MLFTLSFISVLQLLLHPASAQQSASDLISPPLNVSSLSFTSCASPANNLTLSLPLQPPPTNTTANPNPNPIRPSCFDESVEDRPPITMSACASLIFFLLGRLTPEALAPQLFTASGPHWRYTDSSNTCEIELKMTGSYGQEVHTVALILQSAAQIAFICSSPGRRIWGGNAVVGRNEVFAVGIYGPRPSGGVTEASQRSFS